MAGNLLFYGGKRAIDIIQRKGLTQDRVRVVAGAAGGPKWLILGHMDRLLFSTWFRGRSTPLFLVGSSAGSWRFAAASTNTPGRSLERLQNAYIRQWYSGTPTPADITAECRKIFQQFLDAGAVDEILNHPYCRLSIMTVRSRGMVTSDNRIVQGAGLAAAAAANIVSRDLLKWFFHRAMFYTDREKPPFFSMNQFPMVQIPLQHANLERALLASGSIPLIMEGVSGIPGAPPGIYRDGGAIDYHLDIPFLDPEEEGIVLYPHYTDRIIPGWLDKGLSWRVPEKRHLDNLLMICPSPGFVEGLPNRKIPDRKDFTAYKGENSRRIAVWEKACDLSRILADELWDVLDSGKISQVIQPMEACYSTT